MTPRTVNIVCARAPVKVPCVPAVRVSCGHDEYGETSRMGVPTCRRCDETIWRCSFCGARVRVVA